MAQHCETHNRDFEWIDKGLGKSVNACPDCYNNVKVAKERHGPHIKFAQNFWRDRPWNEIEKKSEFGKARRPQL